VNSAPKNYSDSRFRVSDYLLHRFRVTEATDINIKATRPHCVVISGCIRSILHRYDSTRNTRCLRDNPDGGPTGCPGVQLRYLERNSPPSRGTGRNLARTLRRHSTCAGAPCSRHSETFVRSWLGVFDQNRHPTAQVRRRRPQDIQDAISASYLESDSLTERCIPISRGGAVLVYETPNRDQEDPYNAVPGKRI